MATKERLPRTRVGGRFVTAYHPETAFAICERIAEGETLKKICTMSQGMPTRQTFNRWVVTHPECARAYSAARELSAHSLEEDALELAREVVQGEKTSPKVRAFEVAMNQLRWSASRRNPRQYSERGAVQVTVPIQINTNMDMGEGAQGGTRDFPNIYELKAEVKEDGEVEWREHSEEMLKDTAPLVGPNSPFQKGLNSVTMLKNKGLKYDKKGRSPEQILREAARDADEV